jgi:hypothetical protein
VKREMRDSPRPEPLVIGGAVASLVMYFVGIGVDDALGHNGQSLAIGIAVATVIGSAIMAPALWFAFRKDAR